MADPNPLSSGSSPAPARARRHHRLSSGHVVMVVAGVLGALLTLRVLQSADERVEVLVAGRDVPAGRIVQRADLDVARLRADDALLATLLSADDADAAVGRVATTALRKGEVIAERDLRPPAAPEGRRAMSVPVERAHAAGGDVVVGDWIDVIAVDDDGARYVVTGAEVLRVGGARQGSPLTAGGEDFFVKIAVSEDEARAVAAALRTSNVEVVLATGAPPARADAVTPKAAADAGNDGGDGRAETAP